jgi:hypothetical protein
MKHERCVFCLVLVLLLPFVFLSAQTNTSPPPPQKIPVMDGGIGPCSVELTVTTADGKPVYGATVRVHISYGFMGIKRLDLEAGTNSDGKVKFIGLPAKVHNPPLEFHASKDDLTGFANDDPQQECQAKHDLFLEKPKAPPANPQ